MMAGKSNLLIIFADLRMRAQHLVHRLEHIAHALFGNRALDHHDELRLVDEARTRPQLPSSTVTRTPLR